VREYTLPDIAPLGAADIRRSIAARFSYKGRDTSLEELARGKSNAVVLADDLTRPTPAHDLAPHVVDILTRAGIPRDRISFIIAGGLHRPWTREEKAMKLGDGTVDAHSVETHDGFNGDYVDLGTTPRGTPVRINRAVAEADLVVTMGTITKHRFVYATGGSKIILPGVSCRETILTNHKGMAAVRRSGEHKFGDVRLDMDEAAKLVDTVTDLVVIDITINAQRQTTGLHIGNAVDPFREHVDAALKNYVVPFDTSEYAGGKADVGIFRMTCHSCDALQMSRCVDNWEQVCRVPVIICDCHDVVYYDGKRDGTWDEFGTFIATQNDPGNSTLPQAVATADWNIVYSPHLDPTSTHLKRPTMFVSHNWDDLMQGLREIAGERASAAFFRDASLHCLDIR